MELLSLTRGFFLVSLFPLTSPTFAGDYISEQLDRVMEENRRLLSLMEEKDKKINLLEFRIQQMMKDNLSKSEEQLRLQKENTTLLRALTNITTVKNQPEQQQPQQQQEQQQQQASSPN